MESIANGLLIERTVVEINADAHGMHFATFIADHIKIILRHCQFPLFPLIGGFESPEDRGPVGKSATRRNPRKLFTKAWPGAANEDDSRESKVQIRSIGITLALAG